MKKEIYIIRHGETDLNKHGIVQGRGINSDLNQTGRNQAMAFYQLYKDVPFEKIYTSSLKRTHQTVHAFIEAGIAWEALSELDELAWGVWEGQERSEESIHVFRELLEKWQGGNYAAKLEGGESPEEVEFRLRRAIDHIRSQEDEKLVLVCMHGRAMRLLLCILSNKPLSEMADFPHQNTALYKVVLGDDDQFTVTEFNNTDHLNNLSIE